MINQTLKETLLNEWRRTNLYIAINTLKVVLPIFKRAGVSPQAISFITEGLAKAMDEINETCLSLHIETEFKNIIKTLESGDNNGQNTSGN